MTYLPPGERASNFVYENVGRIGTALGLLLAVPLLLWSFMTSVFTNWVHNRHLDARHLSSTRATPAYLSNMVQFNTAESGVREAPLLSLRSKYLEPDSPTQQKLSFCSGFSVFSKLLRLICFCNYTRRHCKRIITFVIMIMSMIRTICTDSCLPSEDCGVAGK